MIQKYYEAIMTKAEEMIEKKCETCLDYIVCWNNKTLRNKACKDWKPDYQIMQDKIEEIEKRIREELTKKYPHKSTEERQN